jgi:hypothetical protein
MTRALPYLWYPLFLVAAIAAFSGLLAVDAHVLVALYSTIVMAGVAVVVLEPLALERVDWRSSRSDVLNDCTYLVVM